MTKIIADTTCGLPLNELADLGIDVIPQIIIFDGKPYKDDSEIDTPTFLAKLKKAKELPKTAAPPPAQHLQQISAAPIGPQKSHLKLCLRRTSTFWIHAPSQVGWESW